MKKIILLYLIFAALMAFPILSQNASNSPVQSIRGQISDADSKSSIYSSYIILLNTDNVIGAVSDFDGKFKIENVPVGRYDIKFTCIGYEEMIIPNVLVGSGKETILNINLTESTTQLEAVEIKADHDKSTTNNDLSMISARGFTVEETKRYAGSLNDPARMASSYAGVTSTGDGNNDIIIRGNSPKGLLWKIEGVESPNPNHFSNDGGSGGPISILNSNILDNSDFLTGAFPSNYGNAYSGVFDIQLRSGNNEKREYAIEAGVLGTDISLEGPFKKGSDASYLVNYRYSTLDILTAAGFKVAGDNVPRYQDAAFKLELPTKSAGRFTLFGVGGKSGIHVEEFDEETQELNYTEDFNSDMALIGIKHTLLLDQKSYLETTLSGSTDGQHFMSSSGDNEGVLYQTDEYFNRNASMRAQSIYTRKINARHSVKTGVIASFLYFDLNNKFRYAADEPLQTGLDARDQSSTFQVFANYKFRINEKWTLSSGLHFIQFHLSNHYSAEPRISAKYQLNQKHSFSAGFGVHSRMETLSQYTSQHELANGEYEVANKNLDFSKARHYVVGYSFNISPNLRFNTEVYYQDLYNVPIESEVNSTFSMLNVGAGYNPNPLVNEGTGENYGIDLTLERYFANNYYFLLTNSFYNSTYKAKDGISRDTRYNGQFVSNALGGKEFDVSRNDKRRAFTVSVKGSVAGGNRYTAIDLEQSIAQGKEVRDESNPFAVQAAPYHRFDLQLKLRTDKNKTAHEWKLDIQNVTNQLNTVDIYYDHRIGEIVESTGMGLLPVLSYKIIF